MISFIILNVCMNYILQFGLDNLVRQKNILRIYVKEAMVVLGMKLFYGVFCAVFAFLGVKRLDKDITKLHIRTSIRITLELSINIYLLCL